MLKTIGAPDEHDRSDPADELAEPASCRALGRDHARLLKAQQQIWQGYWKATTRKNGKGIIAAAVGTVGAASINAPADRRTF